MTDEEKMALELDEQIEKEMCTELEEKDNLLKEKEERYLRMYAEFENYKKRTEKEKQNTALYAKADVVEMLLPVIDSMENAIAIETADENLKQGISLMFEQIRIFLEKNGVEEIGKVGEEFNPELHDAISIQEVENANSGEIISVFRKGYKIKDRIIRHAMVIVAK
jgi:grpE